MTLTTLSAANSIEKNMTATAADVRRNPPADYGDVRAEFLNILAGCGVYDLSGRCKIAVTGGDRVRWMNGMATNNVRDLAQGHGVYSFLLNAQGRIQGDLFVFHRGESLLVDTEIVQREKVLGLFDRFIIADDVEILDVSDTIAAVGLTGPESRVVLERAGISAADLVYLQFAEVKWQEKAITILRSGEEVRESYQIWLAPNHAQELRDALLKAGARATGTTSLNMLRISRGIPQFGVDIRERDLPQETGQTRALNFTKGCYLGQEIVERIRSRGAVHRQFGAFTIDGPIPDAGTKIMADEKEVGEITSSAVLPLSGGDRAVALGYLRREAAERDLRAGAAKVVPTSLPIA
jgi:folate-binding protein YgfZ